MDQNIQSFVTKRLRVLHVLADIRESAMAFKEFVAGMADRNTLSVVSLHKAVDAVPAGVALFEGDGTLKGLFRALGAALQEPFDLYHVHFPNVSAPFLLALLWRRGKLGRTIFTFHTSYSDLTLRNRVLFFFVLCFFRKIVGCSQSSMESIPAPLRRLAGKRLTFIRNGVNIERIDEVRARGVSRVDAAPVLVTACRLVPVKDLRTTLEAFRLSGSGAQRMVIVGDGPERAGLEAFAESAGLSGRLEITGLVGRDEVYSRLLASDVFISTSRAEGLPLAVMEAMACGVPVILPDIPPHREIVGDDFPLIAPGDAAGFAREISRLFALPLAERKALGEAGRRIVIERFGLRQMQDAYDRLYYEVAGA